MSSPTPAQSFPRGILLGAATLLALAIALAATARVTGIGKTPNPTSSSVERVELRFEDRADGAVLVYRADGDRPIDVLAPGTHGFVRGVLRGLVRERRARSVGAAPPFELTRWADGRLSLDDPATGRSIELGAFGSTNAASFVELLAAPRNTVQ